MNKTKVKKTVTNNKRKKKEINFKVCPEKQLLLLCQRYGYDSDLPYWNQT